MRHQSCLGESILRLSPIENFRNLMKISVGFIVQTAYISATLGLSIFALLEDRIFEIEKSDLRIRGPQEDRFLRISSLSLSSERISLDYNRCEGDPKRIASSKLYSRDGVELSMLQEGNSRDRSIVQFAYINLHEVGTEVIGDISLAHIRSTVAKYMAVCGIALQGLALVLMVLTRLTPKSLWSRCPESTDSRMYMLAKGGSLVLILSAVTLWWSIVLYSSVTATILSHLFREARNRCGIEFDDIFNGLYEIRTMSFYVREFALLNGVSIIVYALVVGMLIVHAIYLFLCANGKTLSVQDILYSEQRAFSWYCRIWDWKVSFACLILSVFASIWVANLTKTRGFTLNMFYWKDGAKVSQRTGLSRTGTLLDVVQESFDHFAIPAPILLSTCCVWLLLIPMLAFSTNRTLILAGKAAQDIGTLLFVRVVVAWVTVAPTALSMIEKPECFDQPLDDGSDWSWIYNLGTKQSCNDTMFSVYSIFVFVPAVILLFYTGFSSGILSRKSSALAIALVFIAALLSNALVVVGRHQYSADVHIGACIVVIYMLTQTSPYRLMFAKDNDIRLKPNELLLDRIVPTLEQCIFRLEEYQTACLGLDGLKCMPEEVDEIAHLFRTVGNAIQNAETKNVPSDSTSFGTTQKTEESIQPTSIN